LSNIEADYTNIYIKVSANGGLDFSEKLHDQKDPRTGFNVYLIALRTIHLFSIELINKI